MVIFICEHMLTCSAEVKRAVQLETRHGSCNQQQMCLLSAQILHPFDRNPFPLFVSSFIFICTCSPSLPDGALTHPSKTCLLFYLFLVASHPCKPSMPGTNSTLLNEMKFKANSVRSRRQSFSYFCLSSPPPLNTTPWSIFQQNTLALAPSSRLSA